MKTIDKLSLYAVALALIWMAYVVFVPSDASGQSNPSYSSMGNPAQEYGYLRPDLLAGIRFAERNGIPPHVVAKRRDAVINGTRYPLNDPDIKWGTWAVPTQQWNKATQEWDFRGLTNILDKAKEGGKRYVILRPLSTAAANHIQSIPEHWKTITRTAPNNKRYIAVDVMHEPTYARVKAFYVAFNEKIVKRYRAFILGIDATWAGSVDGGQPSYAGHLGGGNLTTVFGFTQERLLDELDFQMGMWGKLMICHISPNTSDEWVTEFFADKSIADEGCRARRQDSRPFRETTDTWLKAQKFGWDGWDLDIYEITGGHLGAWTKQNGGWYERMTIRYGTSYPSNVEKAFTDVRDREGWVWPMAGFPPKSQEPQYYTHYLEGSNGANAYVPAQIQAFYEYGHEGDSGPIDPPPIEDDTLHYTLRIDGGTITLIQTVPPDDKYPDAIGKSEYEFAGFHHAKVSVSASNPDTFEGWAWPTPLSNLDGSVDEAHSSFRTNGRDEGVLVAIAIGHDPEVPPVDSLALRVTVLELKVAQQQVQIDALLGPVKLTPIPEQ